MSIRLRTTIAVACAAVALLGAGAHAGTAGDGGSGTYTSSGTSYYMILFNAGTTRWMFFHLVGPPGTVFVAGETAAETSARCVVGQPNGLQNEIECGPLAMSVAPAGLHLTFVATTTAPVACRAPFELDVSSTGTGPLTRVDDVTYAGSCATLEPGAVTRPMIHGTPTAGSVLTATAPVWNVRPASVAYRWQLCSAAGCSAIKGATKLTLRLDRRYRGHSVRIVATATVGGATITSASKAVTVR
jgi:hypothetical protein